MIFTKHKLTKQILSIVLVLSLILSYIPIMPITVFADEIGTSETCDNCNTLYNENGFCECTDGYQPATDSNNDGYLEINNIGNLFWFTGLVNGTLTDGTSQATSAKAILNTDLDVSNYNWTPIGTHDVPFMGEFDGGNHSLTFKLSGESYVAPFASVNSATIKNLITKGRIDASNKFAAGLIGETTGNVTVENCLSYVDIYSTVDGDGTHGGLVGVQADSTLTVNNCGFVGSINGELTDSCGGLIGWSATSSIVSNSYVAATFTTNSYNSDTFSRNPGNATINNCYYLNALGSTPSKAVAKTSDEFASGEVTCLLNNCVSDGTQVWYQTIGDDKIPQYVGKTVYENKSGTCNNYTVEYSNTLFNYVYEDHPDVDENGFCTQCKALIQSYVKVTEDNYQSLGLTSNYVGYYAISNIAELYWFSDYVNNTDSSANAVLIDDIVINANLLDSLIYDDSGNITNGSDFMEWTPIGNDSFKYNGTFDGNNHTISGLYYNNTSANYIGFLGYVGSSGTVKNLGIIDSYISANQYVGGVSGYNEGEIESCYNTGIVKGEYYIGGLVGFKYGGIINNSYNTGTVNANRYYTGGICGANMYATIQNCYNSSDINNSPYFVGGICGRNNYGMIKDCYNLGDINFSKSYVGGIVGESIEGTIENCYNTGNINKASYITGGICGFIDYSIIKNCYSTGNVSGDSNDSGGIIGYINRSTVENCYYNSTVCSYNAIGHDPDQSATNTEGKTTAQFANGEVAYLLQSGQSNATSLVWGQNLDNNKDYQHYPVFSNDTVYEIKFTCSDNNGEQIGYSNTNSDTTQTHNYINGICSACGKYQPAKLNNNEVYEISNSGQLYWFAQLVNSGTIDENGNNVPQNKSANAILTANIIVNYQLENSLEFDDNKNVTNESDFMIWTPIGNNSIKYSGTFDGNGYTVSGLYFNNSSTEYVGLFGSINGGTIKTLGITDSYFHASQYIGSVAGSIENGTIENCYNAASVIGTSNYVGGLCGYNSNSTIQNCYNRGYIYNGSSVENVCGYNNSGNITNCYYLSEATTASINNSDLTNNEEAKNSKQFASGEVAYLLQSGQTADNSGITPKVWGQNLDNGNPIEKYPSLSNSIVYLGYTDCNDYTGRYSNTAFTKTSTGHSWTYSLNDTKDTITATCIYENCEYPSGLTLTLTTTDTQYNSTRYDGASINGNLTSNLTGVTISDIYYKGTENTNYESSNAPTNAGTYKALVNITIDENTYYTIEKTFTINKLDITPQVSLDDWIYGEEAKTPLVSGNTENGTVTYYYKLQSEDESNYSTEVPTTAGEYTIKAVISETENYNGGTAIVNFSISKATNQWLEDVSIDNWIYGETAKTPSYNAKFGNDTVKIEYRKLSEDESKYTEEVPTVAGNYYVRLTIEGTENYSGITTEKEFEIAKREISIQWGDTKLIYKPGIEQAPTVIATNIVGNDDVSLVVSGAEIDFGINYTATVTSITGDNASNYKLPENNTTTFKIILIDIDDFIAPEATITIKNNNWTSFLNNITFRLFFKNTVDVYITANDGDNGSGIGKVEYLLSESVFDSEKDIIGDWTKLEKTSDNTYKFSIEASNKAYVYVRVIDGVGNTTIINSSGVVIYTDTTSDTENITFTKLSQEDVSVKVNLNNNTISAIYLDNELVNNSNYTVSDDGTITFKASYLQSLKAKDDVYTISIEYNPLGENYVNENDNEAPATTNLSLKISKAYANINIIDDISKTYDSSSISAPNYSTQSSGDVTVEYKEKYSDDSAYTTEAPKNAGYYTVRISVNSDENYTEAYAEKDFTISKASITITGITIEKSKTYDGSTLATITSNGKLSSNYDGDNLSFTVGTAYYMDKNVGTNKKVSFKDFELIGSAKDNYILTQPTDTTADIIEKLITATFVINNKQYDATSTANIASTILKDIIQGDNIYIDILSATAKFTSGITIGQQEVEVSGYVLTGADSKNYTISPTSTAKANIYNNFIPVKGTEYTTTKLNNGWTNTDFVITAAHDYEVSLESTANDEKWNSTITITEETSDGHIVFYVRNKNTGAISVEVTENYKIDKTSPTISRVEENLLITGDTSKLWMWIALILASSFCIFAIANYSKKRKN